MIRSAAALIATPTPDALAALVGAYCPQPLGVIGGIWTSSGPVPRVVEVVDGRLTVIHGYDGREQNTFALDYFAGGFFCDTLEDVATLQAATDEHDAKLRAIRNEANRLEQAEKTRHRIALATLLHGVAIEWRGAAPDDDIRRRIEASAVLPGTPVALHDDLAGVLEDERARLETLLPKPDTILVVTRTHAALTDGGCRVTLEFQGLPGEWSACLVYPIRIR